MLRALQIVFVALMVGQANASPHSTTPPSANETVAVDNTESVMLEAFRRCLRLNDHACIEWIHERSMARLALLRRCGELLMQDRLRSAALCVEELRRLNLKTKREIGPQ